MSQKQRRLLSVLDAKPTRHQHVKPCSDCPFARTALPGWLGMNTPLEISIEAWLHTAHTNTLVECHVHCNQQCAGVSIYRANVLKKNLPDPLLKLPADEVRVFKTPAEFAAHHRKPPTVD